MVDIPRGPQMAAGDLVMWLFVVLRPGVQLDEELKGRIRRRIREDCSPRHVPDEVMQIAEVPRTLSGKTLEVPVKRILMGAAPTEAASVDSLANPRALDYFVELAQTQLSRRRRRVPASAIGGRLGEASGAAGARRTETAMRSAAATRESRAGHVEQRGR